MRRWILVLAFPLAFLAIPLLGFIDHNKLVIVGEEIARVLAWWIAGAVLIGTVAAFVEIVRRGCGTPISAALSAVAAGLLLYSSVPLVPLQYWSALVAAVLVATMVAASSPVLTRALLAGAAVAASIPAVSAVAHVMGHGGEPVAVVAAEGVTAPANPINVYFFVTDGYSGGRALSSLLDIDNSAMVSGLERRGFVVPATAQANYPMTFMAISAMLEMRYLADETTEPFQDRSRFHGALSAKSAALVAFEALGFTTAKLSSGYWGATRCHDEAQVCFEPAANGLFTQLEFNLLSLTPIDLGRFEELSPSINTLVDAEAVLPHLKGKEPFLFYGHTLPPHPPLIYDKRCERISNWNVPVNVPEGAYERQIACVNQEILSFVDAVAESDPGAIVIITADHGNDRFVDWAAPIDGWSREAILERFNIFTAVKMPEGCASAGEGISPVNLLRLALACVEGRDPALLPNRSFVSVYEENPDYGSVFEVQLH